MEVFENGGSASLCGRAKTEVQRLCVDARKRRFSKTIYVNGIGMPQLKNKTDVFLCVFGGQVWTVENAAKTLVWTKNFLSVFKKQKTEVYENALVWTGPKVLFQVKNSQDFKELKKRSSKPNAH